MLKRLLDLIEIDLLNIEHYRVHTEWRHRNVSSPYSRLYLITGGEGFIDCHSPRRTIHLIPGRMVLIPCFTRVDLFCPRSFDHYYIHLTTRLPNGTDLLTTLGCGREVAAREHGISRKLFDRLRAINPGRELRERDANQPIYRSVLNQSRRLDQDKTAAQHLETNALLRLLLAPFLSVHSPSSVSNTLEGLRRFDRVLEHIQQNLASPIALAELAELAELNAAYFSDLFGRLMGLPPIQYVNRRKMEHAQTLLLTTDRPLKWVARQCGFDDEFYFSRLFKKITGLAPAHYRRQARLT